MGGKLIIRVAHCCAGFRKGFLPNNDPQHSSRPLTGFFNYISQASFSGSFSGGIYLSSLRV